MNLKRALLSVVLIVFAVILTSRAAVMTPESEHTIWVKLDTTPIRRRTLRATGRQRTTRHPDRHDPLHCRARSFVESELVQKTMGKNFGAFARQHLPLRFSARPELRTLPEFCGYKTGLQEWKGRFTRRHLEGSRTGLGGKIPVADRALSERQSDPRRQKQSAGRPERPVSQNRSFCGQ